MSNFLILAGVVVAMYFLGAPLLRRLREGRKRRLYEDALKHALTCRHEGRDATRESLAGALGLSANKTIGLVNLLESKGLIQSSGGTLQLTREGESTGVHVMRAHRLWERYLADDAGMPMAKLHQAADKAEHSLTPERVARLDAHLGHPQRDPHGDPIPSADGSITRLEGEPLTDWPVGTKARIVHIEDEPAVVFEQILAADLRPGSVVRVLEDTPARLVLSDGTDVHLLAHSVAANIQVAAAEAAEARSADVKRLSELGRLEKAEVIELDDQCRGFSRRRLMDLGLTPGAKVQAALENTFGDPRGYRVRGATIALREPQARHIWVRPTEDAA